jgi:hypothetical protein
LPFTLSEKEQIEIEPDDFLTRSAVRVFCLALFFVAVACGYLRWYVRDFRSFKLEDSGIFLYVGQRLAHGDVLYRDIADNKPPLIYWLNEFGLRLAHGSAGGVFVLCLAAGLSVFLTLYWGFKDYVDWRLFIVAGCWSQLAILMCSVHPNYTESYGLPLVALAGVLFVRELITQERLAWFALAQGVIAALLFSLRANNSGVEAIYFVYLLLSLRKSGGVRQLFLFIVAGAGVCGLVLLPLAIQGTLPDYYYNVFRLARPYAGETHLATRLRSLWHAIDLFATMPLFYFSIVGLALVGLLHRTHRYARVLAWLTIWILLEILLSSVSGNHWHHYYLLWIPPLMLIIMLSGTVLLMRPNSGVSSVFLGILAVTLIGVLLEDGITKGYRDWSYPQSEDPAIALARTYAKPGDRITTWGHYDHDIWFDLDHEQGTRWFHEGAFTNRKIYQALMPDFLSDLDKSRPRVVIERRSAVPLFAPSKLGEPLNDAFVADYFQGWDDPATARRKAELSQRYCQATEHSGVVVYLLCR